MNLISSKKWSISDLSEVIDVIIDHRGLTPLKLGGNWVDHGYKALSAKNVKTGKIVEKDQIRYVDEVLYKKWMPVKIEKGDILLTSEGPLGEYYLWNSDEKIVLSQRLFGIRTKKDVLDSRFFYYLLGTNFYRNELQGRATGSTVQGIRQSELLKTKVIYPSIPDQRSIATLLGSLDDKIELLRVENVTLEHITQTIFKEWFVDFRFPGATGAMVNSELGKIPEEWRVGRFTDVADILSGGTPRTEEKKYWNGNIPFFTPKDAEDNFYVIETEKYITEDGLKACASVLYPKDTVFITARGTVGKCVLAGRDMAMNQSCYAINGKSFSNLFIYLLTKKLVTSFQGMANGGVFDAITIQTFQSINVVIPPESLVKSFEKIIQPIFQRSMLNLLEVKSLSELRNSLLGKIFSN